MDREVRRRSLRAGQVFLLGGAFSFIYEGLLTKRMQDGLAFSGLDWAAVLGGPLEWGMFAVVWLHCLQALCPRQESEPPWPGERLVIAGIPLAAGAVYLWKSAFGFYRVEHFLGSMWLLDDLALAAAAVWLWKLYRRSLPAQSYHSPARIWIYAGLAVWFLGAGLLAQVFLALPVPKVLLFTVETAWLAVWAVLLWVNWKDRRALSDEPVRRSRLMLGAAGLRILGSLVLLKAFGTTDDPRMAFWSGLLCDWPSKMLFCYAFLTSAIEV